MYVLLCVYHCVCIIMYVCTTVCMCVSLCMYYCVCVCASLSLCFSLCVCVHRCVCPLSLRVLCVCALPLSLCLCRSLLLLLLRHCRTWLLSVVRTLLEKKKKEYLSILFTFLQDLIQPHLPCPAPSCSC